MVENTPGRNGRRKRTYHHGDLERALVDTAVRMIQEEGIQALTLRGVGARLGVSRTALYRHFDDKQALLARVASEGFKRFHEALAAASRAPRRAAPTRCRRWPPRTRASRAPTRRTTRRCSAAC